jgi:hypothetical protein
MAAGKNQDHLQPGELALLEDFHTRGRIAAGELAKQAAITAADTVLDAGAGSQEQLGSSPIPRVAESRPST